MQNSPLTIYAALCAAYPVAMLVDQLVDLLPGSPPGSFLDLGLKEVSLKQLITQFLSAATGAADEDTKGVSPADQTALAAALASPSAWEAFVAAVRKACVDCNLGGALAVQIVNAVQLRVREKSGVSRLTSEPRSDLEGDVSARCASGRRKSNETVITQPRSSVLTQPRSSMHDLDHPDPLLQRPGTPSSFPDRPCEAQAADASDGSQKHRLASMAATPKRRESARRDLVIPEHPPWEGAQNRPARAGMRPGARASRSKRRSQATHSEPSEVGDCDHDSGSRSLDSSVSPLLARLMGDGGKLESDSWLLSYLGQEASSESGVGCMPFAQHVLAAPEIPSEAAEQASAAGDPLGSPRQRREVSQEPEGEPKVPRQGEARGGSKTRRRPSPGRGARWSLIARSKATSPAAAGTRSGAGPAAASAAARGSAGLKGRGDGSQTGKKRPKDAPTRV